jgi:hypothetical protein
MQAGQTGRVRAAAKGIGAALLLAWLAGCVTFGPGGAPLGSSLSDVKSRYHPTGEYPLADGGERLEFAGGTYGRLTYMLDFDAAGKLVKSEQVLTEVNFANIVPGMPRDELRRRLGPPSETFAIPRQKIDVWNYRYFTGDCLWFQVSIGTADNEVTTAGITTDPRCDHGSDHDR